MIHRFDYLVIGGGVAAAEAVAGIRELDSEGGIGLLSAETDLPYDRPPLSKALWKDGADEKAIRRPVPQDVEWLLGRRGIGLDLDRRRVTDDHGYVYSFRKLLLATGGQPRSLSHASDRVIHYRTLDDYRRLRSLTRAPTRVAVIGGGFIGSEMAAALQWSGHKVTMLVPERGLSARQLPPDLAAYLVDVYREHGVEVRLGESVLRVTDRGGDLLVLTQSGEELTADVVVAGLGIAPAVELGGGAGLAVDNGLVVDPRLRTTHPDVYAAGDVAAFCSPILGRRVRVEHEDNARTMGRVAGRNMAGERAPYDHLPFFYSDLYDLGYEAVGELDPRLEIVSDWRERFREGVVYYLREGRVRGVLLWNVWGQVDAARALIAEPGPFTLDTLRGRLPA